MATISRLLPRLHQKLQLYRYRRSIREAVARGLKLGKNVTIGPTASIDYDYCFLISIGDNSVISKGVRLIAHDATTFNFLDGHTRIGRVQIRDNCYIGEAAIILPGVTIGPNALVAAGSVVNKDIPPNTCVAGVPARYYGKFDEFLTKQRDSIKSATVFRYADFRGDSNKLTEAEIAKAVENGVAYMRDFVGRFPWTWNQE